MNGSNFSDVHNEARNNIIESLETLEPYEIGFIEGFITRMVAQKGVSE